MFQAMKIGVKNLLYGEISVSETNQISSEDDDNQDIALDTLLDQLINETSEDTSIISNEDILPLPNPHLPINIKNKKKVYRRPPYKVAFIPSIRILKRDIRRKYIDMLLNVMNAHDEMLYHCFLKDFYSPDCLIAHSCLEISSSMRNSFSLQGTELLQYLYVIHYYMMPDAIFGISSAKIYQRLNEKGSRIIANITTEATIVYVPTMLHFTFEKVNELMVPNDFQLEKDPKKKIVRGTLMIVLDELNRFCKLEFNCIMEEPTMKDKSF